METASIVIALEAQLCKIYASDRKSDEYISDAKVKEKELASQIGYEYGLIDGRAAFKDFLVSLIATMEAGPPDDA